MTILFIMLNVKYANKSNWYWLGDKPIGIPTMGFQWILSNGRDLVKTPPDRLDQVQWSQVSWGTWQVGIDESLTQVHSEAGAEEADEHNDGVCQRHLFCFLVCDCGDDADDIYNDHW